jgi:hypothetical protein
MSLLFGDRRQVHRILSALALALEGGKLSLDLPLAGKRAYSDDVREEGRRRHAEGETIPELAHKTSIPYAEVKFICSAAGTEQAPAELTLF